MFTSFEKWLTFFEHNQIKAVSVANVGVYNFSTVAFFFWEKMAFELGDCKNQKVYILIFLYW